MYLNKVFIIGNLTRDPELKALPSGSKVCSFGMANTRVFKDRDGKKTEAPEFYNIVIFGRMAETCAQYLKKGSQVLVEGRMQTRSWEQDGQKKYRTEIIADTVQFGNRPSGAGSSASASSASTSKAGKNDTGGAVKDAPPGESIEYPSEEISPDDIPF